MTETLWLAIDGRLSAILSSYFAVFRYKYHASIAKATLGNHAAIIGLKFPFNAKTEAKRPTKI